MGQPPYPRGAANRRLGRAAFLDPRNGAGEVQTTARRKSVTYRWKFGFFVFSHARVRPLTYPEPVRFETMPSRPKPQACPGMPAR
jgi:hypothetical protein